MIFFYEQSNYKVGASENILQLDIKVNKKELFNKNDLENTLGKDTHLSIKKFQFFAKFRKSRLKFNLKKKLFILCQFLALFSF